MPKSKFVFFSKFIECFSKRRISNSWGLPRDFFLENFVPNENYFLLITGIVSISRNSSLPSTTYLRWWRRDVKKWRSYVHRWRPLLVFFNFKFLFIFLKFFFFFSFFFFSFNKTFLLYCLVNIYSLVALQKKQDSSSARGEKKSSVLGEDVAEKSKNSAVSQEMKEWLDGLRLRRKVWILTFVSKMDYIFPVQIFPRRRYDFELQLFRLIENSRRQTATATT